MKGRKGWVKGQSGNPSGRPPGSLNKITGELRTNIIAFLEKNFAQVVKEWGKANGRDKMNFYRELLRFALPQLTNITQDQAEISESEFAKFSNEQLDTIINKLIDEYEKRKT